MRDARVEVAGEGRDVWSLERTGCYDHVIGRIAPFSRGDQKATVVG